MPAVQAEYSQLVSSSEWQHSSTHLSNIWWTIPALRLALSKEPLGSTRGFSRPTTICFSLARRLRAVAITLREHCFRRPTTVRRPGFASLISLCLLSAMPVHLGESNPSDDEPGRSWPNQQFISSDASDYRASHTTCSCMCAFRSLESHILWTDSRTRKSRLWITRGRASRHVTSTADL